MNYETESRYNSMNVKALRKLCASRKIKYCYQMSKTKMLEMLEKNDKDPFFIDDPDTKQICNKYHLKWVEKNREKYLDYYKRYNAMRSGLARSTKT